MTSRHPAIFASSALLAVLTLLLSLLVASPATATTSNGALRIDLVRNTSTGSGPEYLLSPNDEFDLYQKVTTASGTQFKLITTKTYSQFSNNRFTFTGLADGTYRVIYMKGKALDFYGSSAFTTASAPTTADTLGNTTTWQDGADLVISGGSTSTVGLISFTKTSDSTRNDNVFSMRFKLDPALSGPSKAKFTMTSQFSSDPAVTEFSHDVVMDNSSYTFIRERLTRAGQHTLSISNQDSTISGLTIADPDGPTTSTIGSDGYFPYSRFYGVTFNNDSGSLTTEEARFANVELKRTFTGTFAFSVTPTSPLAATTVTGLPVTTGAQVTPTYTFDWQIGTTRYVGQTSATFAVPYEAAGLPITANAHQHYPGFWSLHTSAPSGFVAQRVQPSSQPSIIGDYKAGSTLSVDVRELNYGVTASYQWRINGVTVPDETGSDFTIPSSAAGKTVDAVVTYRMSGFSENRITAAGSTVEMPKFSVAPTPTIAGAASVGSTLRAQAGSWSDQPKLSYQWLVNGSVVKGATGANYVIAPGDLGKRLAVRVTATKTGFATASKTSAQTQAVVAGTVVNSALPKISGSPQVASKLTLSLGTWSASPSLKVQWKANGVNIAGASGTTYILKAADAGKKITASVTATKPGYTTNTKTSAATASVAKSTATLSVRASKKSIKRKASVKYTVTLKTPGIGKPSGKLTVKVGSKSQTFTVKSKSKVTVTVKGSNLKAGKNQKVSVTFTPSGTTAKAVKKSKATSAAKLTVTK